MDQAYTYLQAHPELAANAQVVFLQDMRNADGNNAGHVVLQLPPVEVNRPSLLA